MFVEQRLALPGSAYEGEPYSDHQAEQFIKDKSYPDSSNVMTDGDRTIFDVGERCEHIRQ